MNQKSLEKIETLIENTQAKIEEASKYTEASMTVVPSTKEAEAAMKTPKMGSEDVVAPSDKIADAVEAITENTQEEMTTLVPSGLLGK